MKTFLASLQLAALSMRRIHFSRTTAVRDSSHGSRGDLDGTRRPIADRAKCVHRHASSRGRRSRAAALEVGRPQWFGPKAI